MDHFAGLDVSVFARDHPRPVQGGGGVHQLRITLQTVEAVARRAIRETVRKKALVRTVVKEGAQTT